MQHNITANAISPLVLTRMTESMKGGIGDKLDPALVSPLVAFLVDRLDTAMSRRCHAHRA